jgi:hypothetical protein
MSFTSQPLRSAQWWSLIVAVAGAIACAVISWERPGDLWRAYLTAYVLCWPVTVGAAGLLAIGNLTGGRWASAARPAYLAATRTVPLVAILFIPIALSMGQIFPWATSEGNAQLASAPGKAMYLSPIFFLWRAGGYLVVWLLVIGVLNCVTRPGAPPGSTPAMRRAGALSLVVLAPTAAFAAFDWGMSLEPEWYSSIYGAIVTAAGVLAAHAIAICTLVSVPSADDVASAAEVERVAQDYNDLGNLLLAFLMVFGYLSFSQFLIIWSGNLPHEITWYLRRLNGGWQWLALAMVALGFIAFFQMLARDRKRTPRQLARIAAAVIAMYELDTFWRCVPPFGEPRPAWLATNIAAMAALGGAWMTAYCWHARRCIETYRSDMLATDKSE